MSTETRVIRHVCHFLIVAETFFVFYNLLAHDWIRAYAALLGIVVLGQYLWINNVRRLIADLGRIDVPEIPEADPDPDPSPEIPPPPCPHDPPCGETFAEADQ